MDKHESLTARYERILGHPPPNSQPDELHESLPATSSRRREQVLRAQRTHRYRTQQYIRELEKEVFRLRDENEDLQKSIDQLCRQMTCAEGALIQKRPGRQVDIDEYEEGKQNHQHKRQNDISLDSERNSITSEANKALTIDLTGLANIVPQGSCENHPAEISPPVYQGPLLSHEGIAYEAPTHGAHLTIQTGINFILNLERPCLSHVKHAHMGYATGTIPRGIIYNSGPGHLLTASAMLTHRFHDRNLESSVLSLPGLEIERLLEASERLRLDGEITPVQIWARIRELSDVRGSRVDDEVVDRLARALEKYVYCNSFGAVAERGTVEMVLADWVGD